jgi:hypothetical protein
VTGGALAASITEAAAETTPSTKAAPAAAAEGAWKHARDPRGIHVATGANRGREARFGLMFKHLPAFEPPDPLLRSLAAQMGEPNSQNPFDLDNPRITAGFTFLGQFIDHDMTLDRTPLGEQNDDPHGVTNFRSPLFDLESMYGGGPVESPELYEPDGSGRLRVVRNAEGVDDLPRRPDGTAILRDPRNDENLIIAQLHLLFIKFHNKVLSSGVGFAEAQRLTRWHFQWIIVHDFLTKVAGTEVVARFIGGKKFNREFYKPKNPHRPMMPIEYSVAAYRFGHSMVRAAYLLNAREERPVVAPIFGAAGSDLRGSQPLPRRLEIDWKHLFVVPEQEDALRNQARLIDGKLSLPLFNLPPTVVQDAVTSLAERNLTRGKDFGLPAGQDIARAMGVTPLSNAELGLPNPTDPGWEGKAPLWFYILKEAELRHGGERLGPVGGRLVAEVILGILDADKNSYLNAKSPFTPGAPIAKKPGQFLMGDLVKFVQG